MKKLVINADDSGMSSVFNGIILELMEKGVVSSTSVMFTRGIENHLEQVRTLLHLKKEKNITIGLHFDQEESHDSIAIRASLEAQYEAFLDIFGCKPDHIDKHKWIYTDEEAVALADFSRKHELYIRKSCGGKMDGFENLLIADSSFSLTGNKDRVEDFFTAIKEGSVAELITHPGVYDADCISSLNKDREEDYRFLLGVSSKLQEYGITLVNSHFEVL